MTFHADGDTCIHIKYFNLKASCVPSALNFFQGTQMRNGHAALFIYALNHGATLKTKYAHSSRQRKIGARVSRILCTDVYRFKQTPSAASPNGRVVRRQSMRRCTFPDFSDMFSSRALLFRQNTPSQQSKQIYAMYMAKNQYAGKQIHAKSREGQLRLCEKNIEAVKKQND
jgi:hypothetical protein